MVSLASSSWTRLRYRRAELRRIAPASIHPHGTAGGQPVQWVPSERDPHGSASTLLSPVGARVSYHMTLPADARIVAECTIVVDPAAPPLRNGAVELTIEAQIEGQHLARSLRVPPAGTLSLAPTGQGAATIVLSTRALGAVPAGTSVRWRNPRVEWPRPARDLAAALGQAVRRRTLSALGHRNPSIGVERRYQLWVRENEPSKRTLQAQRRLASAEPRRFTLITLVSAPADGGTRESLLRQSYPHWEWLILTDPPDSRGAGGDAERDPRIRVIHVEAGDTPAARLTRALDEARGEFAALLDDGDVLSPTALFAVAGAAAASADIDVFYSDEDRITSSGDRLEPAFKPEWSPELLLACNYIGRLAMIRIATARRAGGFRDGFGGALEWELLLRLARTGAHFRRITACLYHRRRGGAGIASHDRDAALQDHGRGLGLQVDVTGPARAARLRWTLAQSPTVSIIVPNRNAHAVLSTCVEGLLHGTAYPNRELIIVDNGSTDRDVLELYARLQAAGRARIVPFDRPFNFSAACNAGAAAAAGDLLLFLNNDIEVVEPDWLEELVRWALRPGVGVVGAQLLYPDRMIQHGGVVFGLGLVGHIFARAPEGADGVFGSSDWYRNYLAVTGACQMIPRALFERLGGYDERLRLSFSDVVLCMEAWRAGYRVVYTPHARLIHHESYSRQKEDSAEDMERFARYLRRSEFIEDPYLHPHLDPQSLIPMVRPPFEPAPRQVIAQYIERVLAAAPTAPAPEPQ